MVAPQTQYSRQYFYFTAGMPSNPYSYLISGLDAARPSFSMNISTLLYSTFGSSWEYSPDLLTYDTAYVLNNAGVSASSSYIFRMTFEVFCLYSPGRKPAILGSTNGFMPYNDYILYYGTYETCFVYSKGTSFTFNFDANQAIANFSIPVPNRNITIANNGLIENWITTTTSNDKRILGLNFSSTYSSFKSGKTKNGWFTEPRFQMGVGYGQGLNQLNSPKLDEVSYSIEFTDGDTGWKIGSI